MKRSLFALGIGVLQYSVFHMVLSITFPGTSTLILEWCVFWLCIFTCCIQIFGEIMYEKFFTSRIDETIRKIVLRHIDLINKYDRPDLFADALVKTVHEERERLKKKKSDRGHKDQNNQ